MERFDVIVIGGGHAGAEACAMAARAGCRTLLLTQSLETIGQMSCNPAIGGIAKGTVVREVDALGGIMGRATDLARIQFRMLNRSKGPAVWSPRAQCDRGLYRRAVRSLLEQLPNLEFSQGTVAELILDRGRAAGVVTTDGRRLGARSVVLTAGTFLRGRIHVGHDAAIPAGRAGEPPAVEIAQHIEQLGLTVKRFKTGTPPRIDGRSADLASLARQDGDAGDYWFSFHSRADHPRQLPCYLTSSGPELKAIIQHHLAESALYGGEISGRGPRYCPSIEDKIVKFPEAERHQIFLEPEGLETSEMYVNGLSTSLPAEVQLRFLRTIPGLEQARMTRAGYAIEYDYFPPTQLAPSLQVRELPGLFFAGQINGTTGYEEAAGQGVVAGLNAAASAKDTEPVVFRRDEAFLGVLVDDLVTRGVEEPYRLFTSRSEYRLLLRQDNALRRLLPRALDHRLLSDAEQRNAESRLDREEQVRKVADEAVLDEARANELLRRHDSSPVVGAVRVRDLAKRQGIRLDALLAAAGQPAAPDTVEWAEIELKYEGYLAREAAAAARLAKLEEFRLPIDLAYHALQTISVEGREKLAAHAPATLGQASRIPGVSPSDLQSLLMEIARR
ncbi:MAG TPA: tRNA uridine-5-carboxymethylaminomethyl(34) synthesis enzyme MnmG [Vicinamibacterales bacterium]|nr:tRNA uridine-5-carboxymethylaminomethyl(34) synthesis enzyme MnmG [Vicinamibacterales bacterium]